jgi:HEAT repeat protein
MRISMLATSGSVLGLRYLPVVGLLALAAGCSGDPDYSIPAMVEQMESPDVNERATAISVLKTYGPEAGAAADALSKALEDPDPGMRVHAAYALAAIGPNATPALTALYRALKSPDPELRLAAVYAIPLVSSPDNSAIPKLKKALQDPDGRVREEALKSIRQLELAAKHNGNNSKSAAN